MHLVRDTHIPYPGRDLLERRGWKRSGSNGTVVSNLDSLSSGAGKATRVWSVYLARLA
jgi:hypothetical protein